MANRLTTIQNYIPYEFYAGDTVIWQIENLHTDYSNSAHAH